ncbi:fibroblast growth factor 19 [Pelodytes ibericus]
MWKSLPQILFILVLVKLWQVQVVCAMPLLEARPQVHSDWGEAIRIRHLYTARKHGQESYYLRIQEDGRVDGERHQSAHSLLEIRAVAIGIVAIKGYHSSLYLCMGSEGRLYGMVSYSREDCSFEEELLPDGYNMYRSPKYGIAVSLSKEKLRKQSRGKGYLPLSHFLPVISRVPMEVSSSLEDDDYRYQYNMNERSPLIDSIYPPGLVDSPSYGRK